MQEIARQEVQQVLKSQPPSYEQLKKLDYLTMFIKEVMRMFSSIAQMLPRGIHCINKI